MLEPEKSNLPALASEINAEHAAVGQALSVGLAHAVRAGQLLTQAKATLGHGGWLPWLKENCAVSDRTAQLYMRVAREYSPQVGNPQRVADLSFREAVKLLAAPKPAKAEDPSTPHDGKATDSLNGFMQAIEEIAQVSQKPDATVRMAARIREDGNAEEILSALAGAVEKLKNLHREFAELIALVPPPGCGLHAIHGDDEAFITPSDVGGFYFVTKLHRKVDSGFVAEGTKKPIRQDAIEMALSELLKFDPHGSSWQAEPWPALGFNVWLYDSERHYVDEAVLGHVPDERAATEGEKGA